MTDEEMEEQGLNTCDYCKDIVISQELCWTEYDLEDTPIVNDVVYNYTALCYTCLEKLNK